MCGGALLFPLYRGVYALAHPNIEFKAWCLAAVKACGPGAALSHWAAAVLWELLEPTGRYPDVIARSIKRHDRHQHAPRRPPSTATTHKGIPVTTPAQTIIHLSAVADFKTLRRAVNEALNRRLITLRDLITHTHRGAKQLRAVLATAAPTRSENENAVLHLLHDAGIPSHSSTRPSRAPTSSPTSCGRQRAHPRTDSALPRPLLARADDRTKQAILEALGYTVIRTSWAEITSRPDRMIARVSAFPLHAS